MELFMTLIGLGIVGYMGYLAINRFHRLRNFFRSDASFPKFLQLNFWQSAFQSKTIQKRMVITIAIVALYKLGTLIPIPGVSLEAFAEFQRMAEINAGGSSFVSYGSGKAYSIFHFGLTPYLVACGSLLFLSVVVKPLRKLFFSGQEGRKKIVQFSLILAFVFSCCLSFYLALHMENPDFFMGITIVPEPGILFRMMATLTLVSAFSLMVWFANIISNKGIGNGFAVLVFSDVAVTFIQSIKNSMGLFFSGNYQPFYCFLFILILIGLCVLGVYVTNWKRNISFRTMGKESIFPLRLSWFGHSPIPLAQSILFLPATVASFVSRESFQSFAAHLVRGGIVYYLAYGFLIYLSVRLYKIIVTSPEYFKELFDRFDISCDFLHNFKQSTHKMMLFVSLFFVLISLLPDAMMMFFHVPYFVVAAFGVGGFLVIIGVLYDVGEYCSAIMEADKKKCDATCLIASDEIEATVQQTFLETNGVPCVVLPLRFTWGMPIRTAIDEYRLNVAEDNVQKVGDLLSNTNVGRVEE